MSTRKLSERKPSKKRNSTCFLEDLEAPISPPSPPVMTTSSTAPLSLSGEVSAQLQDAAADVDGVGSAIKPPSLRRKGSDDPKLTLGSPTVALATTGALDSDSFTTAASTLSIGDFCKICHCGAESSQPLIAPCFCSGSLKYVHQDCLQRWIKSSDIKRCELCKYPFDMQSKLKPFCQWETLDMSTIERRKLLCSVSFHIIAVICVLWSLYVLIDRTADEIRSGVLAWPFWTKLVVVGIGFTGGLVFMYVQCKVYMHLCRKWKAYNRIIVVQDAPEGIHKAPSQSRSAAVDATSVLSGGLDVQREVVAVGAGNPSASSSTSGAGGDGDSHEMAGKSNAETQTALRGVSLMKVLSEDADGISMPTTAASAQGIESGVGSVSGAGGGSVKVIKLIDGTKSDESTNTDAAIFFTECECNNVRSTSGALERCGELPGTCQAGKAILDKDLKAKI